MHPIGQSTPGRLKRLLLLRRVSTDELKGSESIQLVAPHLTHHPPNSPVPSEAGEGSCVFGCVVRQRRIAYFRRIREGR